MKRLSLYLAFLVISLSTIGQSCLPSGEYFDSQSDIDNFLINNPDCNTIEGDVMINGNNITNLNGLQNITTFEKGFWIEDCPLLESLSGLENVTYIGDYLELGNLPLIEDINELSNLTYVGGSLDIIYLPALTNINGLENVASAITYLIFWGNESLINMEGINNIQSISTQLRLSNNILLTDISALENADLSGLQYLILKGNPQLSYCEINNICTALENGIPHIDIENNKSGCNNQEEVEIACTVIVSNINTTPNFIIFPNPAKNKIFISSDNNLLVKEVTIYNMVGQKMQHINGNSKIIDISNLRNGIYIIEIVTKEYKLRNRLIIQ